MEEIEEKNFYITDLKNNNEETIKLNKKKKEKNKYLISTENSFKSSKINFIKKLKNKNKSFYKLRLNFFDYLINEEINNVKFEEIENDYIKEIRNNYRKYNNNKLIKKKKKKEYEEKIKLIEKELLNNYFSTEDYLDKYYKINILNYKRKIQFQTHQIFCYNNMYKRLYKTNILITNRLKNEFKYDIKNKEQFEKYVILRDHGIFEIKKQGNLLKKIHNILDFNYIENESLLNKKKKILNQLEFQVSVLKSNNSFYKKYLKNIYFNQNEISNLISKKNISNQNIINEIKNILSNYYSTKFLLFKILNSFKIKNIDLMIKQVNNFENKHFKYKLHFQYLHKQIEELTRKYFEMCNDNNLIKKNIENNKKIILIKNTHNMNIIKDNIKYLFEYTKEIKRKLFEKENFFIFIFMFIIKYSYEIYNSLKSENIKINFKHFNLIKDSKNYHKNLTEKIKEINNETISFFLYLFNNFTLLLFFLYSNTFNKSIKEEIKNLSDINKFEIINFSSKRISINLKKKAKKSFLNLQRKSRIFNRTEMEIFNKRYEKNSIKSENKKKKNHICFSLEDLCKDFLKNYKDKNNTFIKLYPNTTINQIKRFIFEYPKKIEKKYKLPKLEKKINIKKSFFGNLIKKKNKSADKYLEKHYNYIFDSESSDEEIKEDKNNKTKINLSSKLINNKSEQIIFFSRMNDLRNLENQYNEKNKKFLNANEFNKFYHKINIKISKNKLIKNKSNLTENSSNKLNSLSTTNIFNNYNSQNTLIHS